MGELYGGKRRRIASAYPVREPGRHRGRILRFLYLRHRRVAGVRAVVLSLRIGLGAIDSRICELRAGGRGAAGGGGAARVLRGSDRAQIDAGSQPRPAGWISRRDLCPPDILLGWLEATVASVFTP